MASEHRLHCEQILPTINEEPFFAINAINKSNTLTNGNLINEQKKTVN